MKAGLKLFNNKKLTKNKEIISYKKPKYVYIPLVNQNDTNITPLVKKGDFVKVGSIVGKRKGNLRIPIHSSVSGKVIDFVEKPYLNGQMVKCIQIENDFEETKEKREVKKLHQYTKEEFVHQLKSCGVIGMGGNGFPTYVKYDQDIPLHTLIVNATECEPYITADYVLMMNHIEEILDTMDAIMEINHLDEVILAIKKSNQKLWKMIHNYIGTYLKIKVVFVSDKYGIGWERALVQEAKHVTYDKYPLEKGIVVNNVSTIYAIYQALKYGNALTERIVTFTGEMLKEPQNVVVKVGTPVSEVIESIGGYKRNNDIRFVAGGPMMGHTLPNDELVVSPNLNCVLVLKDWKKVEERPCIRCGKCVSVCPAKLCPVLIKDYQKNKRRLGELKPEKCVECGLCDYICPAGIPLREIIHSVKEGLK